MIRTNQCFISWTKALPLKFRKIGFNLYFHTFNSFSSNATSLGYLHCEYTAKTLLWHWSFNILFLISTTFPPVSFAASEGKESKEDYLVKLLYIYQRKRYVRFLELRALFRFLLFSLSFSREQKRIETCV